VSGPKPSASLMPACQGPQATVPDADCRRRQHSQLPRLSLHSQLVHSEANDSLRLAHSLPLQLKAVTTALVLPSPVHLSSLHAG